MIDKSSFEKAVGIASIYASKGLVVSAKDGSPLQTLTSSTNLLGDLPPFDSSSTFAEGDAVSLSIVSDNDGHNSIFDEYVQLLSKSLVFQINNARNIVNPIINDAVNKITMLLKTSEQPEYAFEIVQQSLPAPLQNESFVEEVKKNNTGSLLEPVRKITLKATTVEEIMTYLTSGSVLFDETVKEWLATKGEDFLIKAWGSTFSEPEQSQHDVRPDLVEVLKTQEAADVATFVYLVTRRLLVEEPPEEIKMSLADWKETVREYINASAVVLNRVLMDEENSVIGKKLVTRYDRINKVVYVFSKTYMDYISGGGKNELIFGAILAGNIPYSVAVLMDNVDSYQKEWDRYSSLNKAVIKNKVFTNFKDICLSVLTHQMTELAEFEQEKQQNDSTFVTAVVKSYEKQISCLTFEETTDIYHCVMKLVCNCRFPYTNAYRFLDSINDICRSNPEISQREAALIATIEYVADHMSDQLTVS
jgi:hypothetical protein